MGRVIQLETRDGRKILEGATGTEVLQSPDDIVNIMGTCLEYGTRSLLLYAANLTPRFFDLSSGEAGAILQKLRNYRIRLAVVAPEDGPGVVRRSSRFNDMLLEESRSGYFRIFDDKESAERWLTEE